MRNGLLFSDVSHDSRWTKDVWHKYCAYHDKKDRLRTEGKTADSDSSRNKTYMAESRFRHLYREGGGSITSYAKLAEAKRRMKTIVNSKTWLKIRSASSYWNSPPINRIRVERTRRFAGASTANINGLIKLSSFGMNEYTLIHELAHMVGFHDHHDVGFRRDLVKLVSTFMGRDAGDLLKKTFRGYGLKFTTDVKIKSPEEWLKSYLHMQDVRAARG